jgi:hypothetical protein
LGILGHTEAQAQLGGVPLWTNRYNGPRSDLIYYDYKVDGGGNVFVTGESYGTTNSFADYLTLKYSSALPPSLAIARTATNTVAVSWPSPWSGWSLQMNTDLTTTNWSTPNETIQDNGTFKFIIVNPPDGNRFYRLKSL